MTFVLDTISSYNINKFDLTNGIQNCFVLLDYIYSRTKGIANLDKLHGKGACKSIYKINQKFVNVKSNLISQNKVASASTKIVFDCLVPNGTKNMGCNYSNIPNYLQQMLFAVYWRNCSETEKSLNEIEKGLSNLVNVVSVAFYLIISTKLPVLKFLIQSKYWKY